MENLDSKIKRDARIEKYINSLLKKEEFIDFSKLQKLGQGGTNDVFSCKKNSNFVIKLSREALDKAIELSESPWSNETRQAVNEFVEDENNRSEQLYKYFGAENCLSEKVMVAKISVEYNNWPRDIEGLILIQEVSDVFKNPTKLEFSTGYAERSPMFKKNKDVYDKINTALLGHGEFNEKDIFVFNEKLIPIFELVDLDKEFNKIVIEFLLRFKDYFKESSQFIDLVGRENVLFYQVDRKWFFKLGSVIKKDNQQGLEKVVANLEKNPNYLNEDESLRKQLMNQLAAARLLNAMGIKIGLGKVINIELSKKQLENLDQVKF